MLDNVSIHHSRSFKENLEVWQQCNVCLHYLPLYRPELNLIEILWRKVKHERMPLDAYQSYSHLKK
jgi:transposase